MRLRGRGIHSRALMGVAVVMAALGGLVSSGPAATASESRPALGLGDSVVFGFITQAGFAYGNPNNFIGFPEKYGQPLRLDVTNPACPGETSGSLISTANQDNGCQAFRAGAPLHVAYTGSQLDYATAFLGKHRDTKLVTLLVGANDGFILQKQCNFVPACIQAGLPALLFHLGRNLDTIYAALKHAGFHGTLVGVTYYSLNYNDPAGTGLVQLLNATISQHTLAAGGVVADAFTAFRAAASGPFAAGNTCKAGLLNATPNPAQQFTCDVHPSQSGQDLLSQTVVNAYRSAREKEQSDN
jgi:lysophospholipase L1-like esterase